MHNPTAAEIVALGDAKRCIESWESDTTGSKQASCTAAIIIIDWMMYGALTDLRVDVSGGAEALGEVIGYLEGKSDQRGYADAIAGIQSVLYTDPVNPDVQGRTDTALTIEVHVVGDKQGGAA